MQQPKRILVCPLDWGLGHATRCIPIIRLLIQKGAEVIIAADGRPLELLKLEFPHLKYIDFPGYNISYPDKGSMSLKMILSVPKIIKGIKREHSELKKIVAEYKIDVVISDNRYGCYSDKAKNIFITHQLMIKAPLGESYLHRMVLNYIRNYNQCWIPDFEAYGNLSGDLSHKYSLPENTFFVGPLSRFNNLDDSKSSVHYDLTAIISGPEPQRSHFEKLLLKQISASNLKALIVLGKPEQKIITDKENIKIVSHLTAEEMKKAILNSRVVLARSGYSTIMDLAVLGKKVIFIPTPGQTEQEYLADLLKKQKIAFSMKQKNMDLQKALKESEKYQGFSIHDTKDSLNERIDAILS
jgi:uncharacterized protein (TIGR00661 family)